MNRNKLTAKLAVCLLLLSSLNVGALSAQNKDWRRWSEKDAKKIVKKATTTSSTGILGMLKGATVSAVGGHSKVPFLVTSIWLTDDVCWAIVRVAQLKERRTDDETIKNHAECRGPAGKYYSIFVSILSSYMSRGRMQIGDDDIDVQNPGRIFLQHKKDKNKFLRPTEIVGVGSLGFGHVAKLHSDQGGAIILFPRDKTFLDGQKEIQLELPQEGNKIKLTFKIKDLIGKTGLEVL